jgi:hypothetical protein
LLTSLFCKALCIPLLAVFQLNINAGVGRHIWDLTYPQVFAIGRWSKLQDARTQVAYYTD